MKYCVFVLEGCFNISKHSATLMKCSFLLHFIWVFTVCQIIRLGVTSIEWVKWTLSLANNYVEHARIQKVLSEGGGGGGSNVDNVFFFYFIFFFFGGGGLMKGGRKDSDITKSGRSSAHQRNAI